MTLRRQIAILASIGMGGFFVWSLARAAADVMMFYGPYDSRVELLTMAVALPACIIAIYAQIHLFMIRPQRVREGLQSLPWNASRVVPVLAVLATGLATVIWALLAGQEHSKLAWHLAADVAFLGFALSIREQWLVSNQILDERLGKERR